MLVGEYLLRSAERTPEKVALVCGQTRLTYGSLARSARGLSAFLIRRGLMKGDRVGIYLDNSPEAVVTIFGVTEAGGCCVGVNPLTPAERLGYILEHCGARWLVSSADKIHALRDADLHCTNPPFKILVGDNVPADVGFPFRDACLMDENGQWRSLIDLDLAAIIYTSGSTGKPKGVTMTHRNVDTVVESVAAYLAHTPDDVILQFLPLSIGYGLLQLLVTFRTGGRLILERGFSFPYEVIKRIRDERVTGFAGVPTIFSVLTQLKQVEKEDISFLRYITNAAAALPPSFVPRLKKVFPSAKIYLMHGLTECFRTTYLPPEEIDRRPTSVGRGMPNVELWIEDPDGNRLGSDQVGELVVRGSNVMLGYWNDPETTARVIKQGKNPWERILHTSDLFRMDEDGYFYFVARMDDVIKSRGMKVSPLEIEDVIYTLDEVQECRVMGVPDTLLGQAIKAEIVLKKGITLSERDVKAHCHRHLEEFKIPHIIAFVESLPKSPGGKIRRVA